MAYSYETHRKRIALRSDLTIYATHLTRARAKFKEMGTGWDAVGKPELDPGKIDADALDVLCDILETGMVRGSRNDQPGKPGYIVGGHAAACFQTTPIYSLGQMFFQERQVREARGLKVGNSALNPDFRYTLYGVSFTQGYLYAAGGRPVFYEKTKVAQGIVNKDEWWRIVDFDYSDSERIVDWTHEREWRVKGDFKFDLKDATIVLPDPPALSAFRKHSKQMAHDFISKVASIVVVSSIFY